VALSVAPHHSGVALEVVVLGRDCEPMSDADLRRLFAGSTLTADRLDRLRDWPRVLVTCTDRIVGVATCQRVHDELVVPDLAIAASAHTEHEVLHTLLDALENACLAGGARRIVLSPPRASLLLMQRRGYLAVRASCAGCWLEKAVA